MYSGLCVAHWTVDVEIDCTSQLSNDCIDLTTKASIAQDRTIYSLDTEHGSGSSAQAGS